ncbi:MAG: hypothetical protein CMJ83_21380 [Planctomycetes bacterium]|nr:hypothetical protein [Planctomycetota bacterium]
MPEQNALEPRLLATLNRILAGLPDAGPTLSGLLDFCNRELEALFPRLCTSFAFAQGEPLHLVIAAVPQDPTTPLRLGALLVPENAPGIARLAGHESVLVRVPSELDTDAAYALAGTGYQRLLLVPLLADGDLLGTWNLASRDLETFDPSAIDLLSHLGDAVALAASRTHLQGRVEQQTIQLVESEKLAAVGRLVAGVAHELGGPLQAIISLAEVLGRNPERDDRLEAANRILRSALRCRGMVQDLLTYARKHPHRLVPVQASNAIMDALELDRFSDVGEVQIHLDGPHDVPAVMADQQRLTQVFLNLITNARHATALDGQPGLVRVRIAEIPGGESRLTLPDDATVVQISVEDQGPGVPEEIRLSIFEPFVTTKPEGRGTGLGLSVSRSLLMDMSGLLYIDETYGPGAKFVVELPACDEPVPQVPDSADPPPAVTCTGQRILLIDDDREILETYEVILGLDDHIVRSCDRGKKALEILQDDTFDVILCDIRLPDLPGPAFLQHLQQTQPELARRVIFATGDVVNDQTRAFLASIPNPALLKPFQVEDLQRAIAKITS